jgi:hypothetical protein
LGTSITGSLPQERVHTVQFYGDDGVLLHELNNHIGSALASGSSAVVIATAAHIDNLNLKLKSQGIDLSKAEAENRYTALEAADFFSKFMSDGRPDSIRFSEVMGGVIARAAEASQTKDRRVVAFGEMVALLWAEGNAQGAIQLEKLGTNWRRPIPSLFSAPIRCKDCFVRT